jgi:hypothetical protein
VHEIDRVWQALDDLAPICNAQICIDGSNMPMQLCVVYAIGAMGSPILLVIPGRAKREPQIVQVRICGLVLRTIPE